MIEKIKLLTLCGCSRMVEATVGVREYICPIQSNIIELNEKTEPFPKITLEQRVFRYQGKKTKDTHIRIFEETT